MSDKVTLSVYECSEFHSMGEMHENIESVDEAIKIWDGIPATRMNGIKSISVGVGEGWDSTEFEAVVGKRMDLEMLNYYSEVTANHRAMDMIKELQEKISDLQVIGEMPNQQETHTIRPRRHR